ncbi:lytic transglycosylase domain-containing protein [Paeniroseomonas aquatica]|uniref:Lytic transglycosylase domain-containing protein n=1 Tax=Paeniroseomonas aquatica TaxID=373043 RepID=A0ABT8A195_9PROT|nr:lytic transglycosylase domain-containing protein [Paeniroseomonas aquatica]MDN3563507.1 lytic transglycosylase domain-containing protein [Paeniroseomonas aquatica]
MPRLLRPALTLSMLAVLAACGQKAATTRQPATHVAVTHGSYNRPASYSPPGTPGDPWGPYIRQAARRFDVPERWVREVMRQESGGRTGATSPVGAMGLMQVMPGTYRELQSRYGLGDDPYHPYDSIMAGTAYIREMYDLYGSPAFLAAYNAGPRRLEDYLWNSKGLPAETRNYVARIGPNIVAHHPSRRVAPEIYAAAEIPLSIPAGPRRMDSATMLALREQRQAVDPGIQVARLPAGPVVRMEPIPDGSTGTSLAETGGGLVAAPYQQTAAYTPPPAPAPVRLASLDGGAVMRMDPIPDGSTSEGAARLLESEARASAAAAAEAYVPPAPAYAPPPAARPAPFAAARPSPPAARPAPAGRVLAAAQAAPGNLRLAAATQPASSLAASRLESLRLEQGGASRGGFGLLGTAQASSLPATLRPGAARPAVATATPGGWAVQVGAFASQNLARDAAATARDAGAAGRVMVQPVAAGRNRLYRARVTGLSQPAAQAVCDRLRRSGACMVLSPDAQG